MIRLFSVLLLVFVSGYAVGQSLSYKDFLGKWKGKDEKSQQGAITFIDSARMTMSIMGSQPIPMYYRLDLSKIPARLNIYRDLTRKGVALKSLIQLLDPNTLKWQVFPDGEQHDNFEDKSDGTLIILQKGK